MDHAFDGASFAAATECEHLPRSCGNPHGRYGFPSSGTMASHSVVKIASLINCTASARNFVDDGLAFHQRRLSNSVHSF